MISGFQDDDLPAFARIDDIILIAATPVLSVCVFKSEGINNHLQCYAIKNAHQTAFILLTQLLLSEPLSPHQVIGDNNTYIALRTYVPNMKN